MLQRLWYGSKNAVLLVAQGTSEPIEYELLPDPGPCRDELMRRAELFRRIEIADHDRRHSPSR